MSDDGPLRSIRVRILGREYPLRVRPSDEALTRDMAAYVEGKMRAFKQAHPEQSDVTAAVVVSLALAEELYAAWEAHDADEEATDAVLDALDARLAGALGASSDEAEDEPDAAAAAGAASGAAEGAAAAETLGTGR